MKKISLIFLSVLILVTFVSCGEKIKGVSSLAEDTTSVTGSLTETGAGTGNQNISAEKNPLTGVAGYNPAAVGKRPVAVMVNNIKNSLPQYGIEQADVIYEIPVEGGITRLMAVYADYTNVPDVCSVRSCRYYYPIIAYGMDAIYCHWGRDTTIANDTLNRLDINNLDGSGAAYGTLFFRDEEREKTYDVEHTGYLKGSALPETIEEFEYRTDILEENSGSMFKFNPENNPVVPSGAVCMNADVPFSESYYSDFEYDSTTKLYKKYHSGEPHMDVKTGNQIAFTNVFILFTDIELRGEGKLLNVGLSGGDGYYISNGAAQQIHWYKDDEDKPIRITDLNDTEINVNAGKSYIGLISNGASATIN